MNLTALRSPAPGWATDRAIERAFSEWQAPALPADFFQPFQQLHNHAEEFALGCSSVDLQKVFGRATKTVSRNTLLNLAPQTTYAPVLLNSVKEISGVWDSFVMFGSVSAAAWALKVVEPTKSDDWGARFERILGSLSRLNVGWAGPASVVPSAATLRDIEAVADYLPSQTREPDVEVDPTTGTVSFIWFDQGFSSSFSLVFTGSGQVTGVTAGDIKQRPWKFRTTQEHAITDAVEKNSIRNLLIQA